MMKKNALNSLIYWLRECPSTPAFPKVGLLVLPALLNLSGCATWSIEHQSDREWEEGQPEAALTTLKSGMERHPESATLKSRYLLRKEAVLEQWQESIKRAQQQGKWQDAEASLKRALAFDPNNPKLLALQQRFALVQRSAETEAKVTTLAKTAPDQALEEVNALLKENPRHEGLRQLRRTLEQKLQDQEESQKRSLPASKISLDFKEAPLKFVFEAITRSTGVLIQADKDIPATQRVSINMRDASVEDAMDWLSKSAQLVAKPINSNAWMVYPNTEEKRRQHDELIIKTYTLSHAEAKTLSASLKQLLNLKDVVIDERLNMMVLRETKETLKVVDALVMQLDQVEPEALLDIDIMEVNRSRLLQLGLQLPNQASLSLITPESGLTTLSMLRHLHHNQLSVGGLNSVGADFRREMGDLDMLASPKIRVKHHGKASVLIGDRVPTISSTYAGGSSGFVTESITYTDVGLKFSIENVSITPDQHVQLKLQLEVSNIASQVPTKNGSVAYQIGTRKAETELIIRDGETQILAGLLSHEERSSANRLPGVGDLPVVGRLFGTTRDDSQKTEIVLSITPRILRNLINTEGRETEIYSGTYAQIRSKPAKEARSVAAKPVPSSGESSSASKEASSASVPTLSNNPNGLSEAETSKSKAITTQKPSAIELKWAPLEGPLALDKSFTVMLNLKSDGGLRGMPIQLQFDPKKIQVESAEAGNYFDQGSGNTLFNHQVLSDGRIMISLQRSQSDAVMGENPLLKLRLKPLQAGSSTLTVLSASPMGLDQVPAAKLAAPLQLQVP